MFALYLIYGLIMHMGRYWVPHLVLRMLGLDEKKLGGWLIWGWCCGARMCFIGRWWRGVCG
jgi:hypothetical protein